MDDWKSSLILSDLQAACNALGGWEDAAYVKEADCVESLKDLFRAIRRDDESFAVRRALGQINVIRTDLIPLVRFYHEDEEIFDIATKLLVNLTTPVILLYKEELPIEKNARHIYMTLESMNCTYKDAFLEKEIWTVLGERLEKLMNLNYSERSDEDKEIMERILILMRNVLHPIHKEELTLKTDGDVSSHDRLLWALHLAGIDDLIIYLCAARMEQSYTLHVLEILRLMLREQEPEFLASTGEQRSKDEVQKEVDELIKERDIELRRKKLEMKAALQNRFARFSSAYQVKNLKSLNDSRDLVIVGDQAKVLQSLSNVDLDKKKKFRARAKNRRPETCTSIKRRTTLNIRLFLKEFCCEFLNSAFNSLLPQARRALTRSGDAGDEGHYFWLLDFFLAFNRMTGFDISLVSEAISRETFHYVQTQVEKCHEMMMTDKRNVHLWVKRLHLHLKTFKQLLMTVSAMGQHKDPQVCEASKILQKHLFNLPEYRDVALHLLLNFNENVAPVEFPRDLACTIHIYLRMMERCSSRGQARAVKKKVAKPKPPELADMPEEELNEKWLDVSKDLTTYLDDQESQINCDINEVLEGFHQYEEGFHVQICKHKIAELLRVGDSKSAIGLLEACQRHFPEEECFGDITMTLEDKFMLLRKFFFAENISRMDDMPDLDDDDSRMADFNVDDFLKRFVNPKVVKAYSLLLSHFRENSQEVNKVCLKMLHRIAFEMKMSAMLFQAEIFVTFDKIFEDYAIMPERSDLKELARFAKFIISQFAAVMKINDLALVELLFWKTSNEAYQIQYGYNESNPNSTNKAKPWTEEEEEELRNLYAQHKDSMEPGQDVIESVQKDFSNETRTRRQIINQLRNMGLVEKGARFKPTSASTSSNQPWSIEEEQELQELYQKFATSIDPLTQIMLEQSVKRPKFRVIEKLLELGCIHDRSEVRKRRARKNGEISLPRKPSRKRENDPSCISKEFLSTTDDSSSDEDRGRHVEEGETFEGERERPEGSSAPPRGRDRRKKKNRRSKPRRRVVEKINNSEELQCLLKTAAQTRKPAIDWIIESMQDAIEDWKDQGNEPVPLVPLASDEHESLENEDFCRLLSTFGFVPPQEGIEQYWRIAGDLTPSMLKSRLEVLQKAIEGTFDQGIVVGTEDNEAQRQSDEGCASSSSDDGTANKASGTREENDGADVGNDEQDRDAVSDASRESSPEPSRESSAPDDEESQRRDSDENGESPPRRDSPVSEEESEAEQGSDAETPNDENDEQGGSSKGATKRGHTPSPEHKTNKKRKVAIESDESEDGGDIAETDTPNVEAQNEITPANTQKAKRRAIIESDDDMSEEL
ncbi:protein timeless homolog [Galendromus occidentalis]|uniref:Protein timeless homolog n=1 Tax=Galendromus occidentalis TaxID=34638 RepID=A0AAJ6QP24_9ACAR|nr:protein timeless homolog [Galendromus occidentalis]